MKNIAILFDIENILGGYSFKYLYDISLKDIIKDLHQKGYENIAIQRAYADWSNIKLNSIKWDIAKLGIEPIQMYGFSKGATKNASDIQLVIDALEILHTKPFIETFIIVSGDGGFTSLAKKLSEYGKKVVGLALKNSTNDIFKSVCDEFIYIEKLKKDEIPHSVVLDNNKLIHIKNDPILKDMVLSIKQIDTKDLDIAVEKVHHILRFIENHHSGKYLLARDGMNISIFASALHYSIKDFKSIRFGFVKLVDFLRYVLKDTNFKLIYKEPSEFRILKKSSELYSFTNIEPLWESIPTHSFENYKTILSHSRPTIYIPENKTDFYSIINRMLDTREFYNLVSFGEILDSLVSLNIDEVKLNKTIHLLINTGVLVGDQSSIIVKEQNFSLSISSVEQLLSKIEKNVINKLNTTIESQELDSTVLNEIMEEFQ